MVSIPFSMKLFVGIDIGSTQSRLFAINDDKEFASPSKPEAEVQQNELELCVLTVPSILSSKLLANPDISGRNQMVIQRVIDDIKKKTKLKYDIEFQQCYISLPRWYIEKNKLPSEFKIQDRCKCLRNSYISKVPNGKVLFIDVGSQLEISCFAGNKIIFSHYFSKLGGNKFDKDLVASCVESFEPRHISLYRKDPVAQKRLEFACRLVKESFGDKDEVTANIYDFLDSTDFVRLISKDKLIAILKNSFNELRRAISEKLKIERVDEIDEIVLAGRAANVPGLQNFITRAFKGASIDTLDNFSIAKGAALEMKKKERLEKIDKSYFTTPKKFFNVISKHAATTLHQGDGN